MLIFLYCVKDDARGWKIVRKINRREAERRRFEGNCEILRTIIKSDRKSCPILYHVMCFVQWAHAKINGWIMMWLKRGLSLLSTQSLFTIFGGEIGRRRYDTRDEIDWGARNAGTPPSASINLVSSLLSHQKLWIATTWVHDGIHALSIHSWS